MGSSTLIGSLLPSERDNAPISSYLSRLSSAVPGYPESGKHTSLHSKCKYSKYLLLSLLVSTFLCSFCNDSSLGNTHDKTHFLCLYPQPSSDQPLHGSHICLLKRVFFLVIPFYQAFLGFLVYGAKSALQQGV